MQSKPPQKRDPLEEAASLFDPQVAEQLRQQRLSQSSDLRERFDNILKKVKGR